MEDEIPESDLLQLFTVPEIARRFRTDETFIRRLIESGELRGWRMRAENGHWRVSAKSLMEFLNRRDEAADLATEAAARKTKLRVAR